MDSLPENDRFNIQFYTTSSVYQFCDRKTFNATKKAQIPADIDNYNLAIEIDDIDSEMPLLFPRVLLNGADKNISFKDYTASVLGETLTLLWQKVTVMLSPLTVPCQIIHKGNSSKCDTTFTVKWWQRKDGQGAWLPICPCSKWKITEVILYKLAMAIR